MWCKVERVTLHRDASAETTDHAIAFEYNIVLAEVVGCAQAGEPAPIIIFIKFNSLGVA